MLYHFRLNLLLIELGLVLGGRSGTKFVNDNNGAIGDTGNQQEADNNGQIVQIALFGCLQILRVGAQFISEIDNLNNYANGHVASEAYIMNSFYVRF